MRNSEKPILIVLCGKSAVGKDTAAKRLNWCLRIQGYDSGLVVSDTTRPPRSGEVDGRNYRFLSEAEFSGRRGKGEYLEWTEFREWCYGTPQDAIRHHYNVCVLNPAGIKQLRSRYDVRVVPILLEQNLFKRLWRSYRREGRWRLEFLRRCWRDHRDFKGFKKYVNRCFRNSLVLKGYKPLEDNVLRNELVGMLLAKGVLRAN